MNAFSTSSAVVNLVALDLNGIDTCYCDIGGIIRRVKDFFEESNPITDTKSIRELENSVFKTVSKECLEFCYSRGLSSILANCLKRVKDIFSNIVELSAELDYFRDDQAEDVPHVVIRVEVNSDQETALQEYDQLVCWMAEHVAPSETDYFTMTVKRV